MNGPGHQDEPFQSGTVSMDARRTLPRLLCAIALAGFASVAAAQALFQAESVNFTVAAPDQRLAAETARLAEHYRRELSLQWLGRELPAWQERCPITVEIGPHAGGETTFAFVNTGETSAPTGWQMKIYGPPERILDAVLPHEVTHTIFATHFGQPLPRWADEGACTTVEHASEREKIQRLLYEFLSGKPSRGLPFNRMFTLRQYPPDMLPLYAQAYSVARYLIQQRGHQHFVRFVEAGLAGERQGPPLEAWDQATRQYYGFGDLSELQVSWLSWVAAGSRETGPDSPGGPVAIAQAEPSPASNGSNQLPGNPGSDIVAARLSLLPRDSWYRQQLTPAAEAVSTSRQPESAINQSQPATYYR